MNAKSKQLLKDYENEIVKSWHVAQENDGNKIGINLSLTQAGLCAERICQATYIRIYGVKPKKTFHKLTLFFFDEGVFDIQMKTIMNTIRPIAATGRHESITIERAFMDKIRLFLMDAVLWYQKKYRMEFPNLQLKKYQSILYRKPAHAYKIMNESGHLSDENYNKNMKDEVLVGAHIEEKKLLRTPIYTSLLVDVSGSMIKYTDEVIRGHKESLSAIRGSMVCKQKALFLMQHLFNHESKLLNSLTLVDKSANDSIVALDKNNYRPHSTTALFDTLYEAINLLCLEVNSLKMTKGRKPEIIISVMTDGIDNQSSSHTIEDIKKLMEFLKKENVIKSSVLIGWTNPKDLNIKYLTDLQSKLGFEEAIAINQSDPKSVRKAFKLFSERVV
jgi:hypothetical protein